MNEEEIYEKALEEFLEDPVTYTLDEVEKELDKQKERTA